MREVIMTGKTVEEATELALQALGIAEEDVSVEVIDMPQRKLFRSIPAKVRVTVDAEEEIEQEQPKEETPVKSVPVEKIEEPQSAPIDLESDERVNNAIAYLSDVCSKMGVVDAKIVPVKKGETVILTVEGEETGALIGHRGEVMESLGYLCSLVANRNGGDYLKLGLDVNNYRNKREENLITLAKRIGTKVAKTNRSHTLEPMNPYERRIIHSAIGEMEGVKSESIGDGMSRRVVIMSTDSAARKSMRTYDNTHRKPPYRKEGGAGRHQQRGYNRDGGAPKSKVPTREFADRKMDAGVEPTAQKRTEVVNDGAELPLFGKIEL